MGWSGYMLYMPMPMGQRLAIHKPTTTVLSLDELLTGMMKCLEA